MIRPSRRLLAATLLLLGFSALAIASGALPEIGLALPWAALLAAAAVDAAISPWGRDLRFTLSSSDEVYSGERASFAAHLEAPAPLPPQILGWLEPDPALGPATRFTLTGSGRRATGRIGVAARRRGVFRLRRVWLDWRSRFGFWQISPRVALQTTLTVVPNIRPVASGKIDVVARSELYGIKDNSLIGGGAEFHQMRDFVPGMDTRSIDWKRSARRRDLAVKEMRAERNHQVMLVLDNGHLMREEIADLPKIDHAVNAALATAWAAGIGGDLVGLYSFDATPGLYVPPRPGRAAFPALRRHMATLSYRTVAANPTLALIHLHAQLKRRSLIVVFSDFADTTTAALMVEALTLLNRRHIIVFATFRDPTVEARLARPTTDLSAMAETVAAAEIQDERRRLLDGLARMGVLCLETEPGALTARLVSTYLRIKARDLI